MKQFSLSILWDPKAWSAAYSTIDVHDVKIRMKAWAIVAAISEDIGYEHHLLNLKSISTE